MAVPAWKWMMLAAAVMATAAGIVVFHAFDPNAADSIFPRCIFNMLTGYYCPGCGLTRALHALAHGDVARALAMNAFATLSLPLLPVLVWYGDRPWALPPPVARVLYNGYLWVAAIAVFGIARNLPWPPFAWLAPG